MTHGDSPSPPLPQWVLIMQRILKVGRTLVAALFAVSLMLIVMLIAAVLAVPALAAGTPGETRAAARAKPAAAVRSQDRAESPVQSDVAIAPAAAVVPETEAKAPELPQYPKHLIVLKVVNLLSPPQLDEILKQAKGEGRITQDTEHHLVILRGDNSFMVSSMDLLKRAVHLRKDAWPDKDDTGQTLVEVYRFMRIEPKEGIELIKRTLPKNEAKIELRESSKAVVIEGSYKAVNEVMDLLQQSDGLRPHFMVRKAFDIKTEPVNRTSGEQRVDDERERE